MEDLLRRIEDLENWKKNLESSHSIPLNIHQAFTSRFGAKTIFATVTLDFGSVASLGNLTLTTSVPGAKVGYPVAVSGLNAIANGLIYSGYVATTGLVTVRVDNYSAGAVDPSSSQFNIAVLQ